MLQNDRSAATQGRARDRIGVIGVRELCSINAALLARMRIGVIGVRELCSINAALRAVRGAPFDLYSPSFQA